MLKVDMDRKAGGAATIVAQGDILEITADIAHIISAIHTQFNQSEPALAGLFKTMFTELVMHPTTPLWKPQGDMCGTLIATLKK